MEISKDILERAQRWTGEGFDAQTRQTIQKLLDEKSQDIVEGFYKELEFGTGGLRGIMGLGSGRINRYTLTMATQGLVNYIKKQVAADKEIKVAIAYDSRLNSDTLAAAVSEVFLANGCTVYMFESARPVPELSFTIRHYGCISGVMITASHNPKEYNGYKVYWEDGAQVLPPHDVGIIDEVRKVWVTDIKTLPADSNLNPIMFTLGAETDKIYLDELKQASLIDPAISMDGLKVVYTALHGTGSKLVPGALERLGVQCIPVKEQWEPDGNFPTVKSPNPEEGAALEMAVQQAKAIDADLVMGTDPDTDRVGIAVKNDKGEWVLLNGNQTACLLFYYMLESRKAKGLLSKGYVVKTIVTTELLAAMAAKYSVACDDVLTGFKYIAEKIREREPNGEVFIAGAEESYGYLFNPIVRDKDAVQACMYLVELLAWARATGKGSLYNVLMDIYKAYGLYLEKGISVVKAGKQGAEEIAQLMTQYRQNPPKSLGGSPVVKILDCKQGTSTDLKSGNTTKLDLPTSDVLQFFTEDGSKVTIRPSGTEPKIKFYVGLRTEMTNGYADAQTSLEAKLDAIRKDLNI